MTAPAVPVQDAPRREAWTIRRQGRDFRGIVMTEAPCILDQCGLVRVGYADGAEYVPPQFLNGMRR